ncbi:MAG: Hsp20/alpha crystallin family protein [bacterium]
MNTSENSAPSGRRALDKIKGEVEHVFERLAENWHEFEASISEHLPEWIPKVCKPKVDASELNNVIEFSVEVPGLDANDIEVLLENGVLVIKGEKETASEQQKKSYYLKERSMQQYYRSLQGHCKKAFLLIGAP